MVRVAKANGHPPMTSLKAVLHANALLPLSCVLSASPSASASQQELAIATINVELQMTVQVVDADTGAPISGATIALVRVGEGKELAP